jgi:RNA polymerase sigma-70 factor, ECF subfamily
VRQLGATLLTADEHGRFLAIYEKTSEGLFRKAYRLCSGHEADAKDVHQRTYLKALEHWDTFSTLADQQRYAWLARTLAREALQVWREPHRSRETGPCDAERQPRMPDDTNSADASAQRDCFHKACRAISQLEGRQAEVVALHCLAGYEISEVAEMLDIKVSTVRVHLHDGRQRLRRIMTGEEGSARDHV